MSDPSLASRLDLILAQQYGRLPPLRPVDAAVDLLPPTVMPSGAIRRVVRLTVGAWHGDLLWHHPAGDGPWPVVVMLNFYGNHTTSDDVEVPAPTWTAAPPMALASQAVRWPLAEAITRGVGVATLYASEAFPDHADCAVHDAHPGIRALDGAGPWADRAPTAYGALAAWAWTLSLLRRWLATQPHVDASRFACFGHSRLGKAALLAGATDPGFAVVAAMGSGTCGQSPSRKTADAADAETTEAIQRNFPHWFTPAFAALAARPAELPFDQDDLLRAIAPRRLVLIDGLADRHADPLGAQALARRIAPAWGSAVPPLHHLRDGGHAITADDWAVLLDVLATR